MANVPDRLKAIIDYKHDEVGRAEAAAVARIARGRRQDGLKAARVCRRVAEDRQRRTATR